MAGLSAMRKIRAPWWWSTIDFIYSGRAKRSEGIAKSPIFARDLAIPGEHLL